MSGSDPVHQKEDGQWYFWDEVGAEALGPYTTETVCREAVERYAEALDSWENRERDPVLPPA